MTKVKLLDTVALKRAFEHFYLKAGDVGTVVETYGGGLITVEFIDAAGDTVALLTLDSADVRRPTKDETGRLPGSLPDGVEPVIADTTAPITP